MNWFWLWVCKAMICSWTIMGNFASYFSLECLAVCSAVLTLFLSRVPCTGTHSSPTVASHLAKLEAQSELWTARVHVCLADQSLSLSKVQVHKSRRNCSFPEATESLKLHVVMASRKITWVTNQRSHLSLCPCWKCLSIFSFTTSYLLPPVKSLKATWSPLMYFT